MKMRLAVVLFAIGVTTWAADSQYLTYDDLIRQIEAGNVKAVTIDHFSAIEGTLRDGTATKPFHSYGNTGTANDPLLTRFLKEHHVVISIRDTASPKYTLPMMTGLLFLAVPLAVLILLVVILRKLNRILANQKNQPPPINA